MPDREEIRVWVDSRVVNSIQPLLHYVMRLARGTADALDLSYMLNCALNSLLRRAPGGELRWGGDKLTDERFLGFVRLNKKEGVPRQLEIYYSPSGSLRGGEKQYGAAPAVSINLEEKTYTGCPNIPPEVASDLAVALQSCGLREARQSSG